MESYVLKCDRGRAVHGDEALGMSYWVERNWCIDEDTSIRAHQDARNAFLAEFRQNAGLSGLHDAAVDWRQARFESLLENDHYRALYGRLLMTPPSRPVRPDAACELYRIAQKMRSQTD